FRAMRRGGGAVRRDAPAVTADDGGVDGTSPTDRLFIAAGRGACAAPPGSPPWAWLRVPAAMPGAYGRPLPSPGSDGDASTGAGSVAGAVGASLCSTSVAGAVGASLCSTSVTAPPRFTRTGSSPAMFGTLISTVVVP